MGVKKNNEDIKVEFLGNSAIDVTQSCIRITFLGKVYLIECGGAQGYGQDKCYTLNSQLLTSINVDNLECVWVCHEHCDHIGMLPGIVKKPNFHAKIFCTYEAKEIGKILLLDAAHILLKEAETLSKEKKCKIDPLYREADVHTTYDCMVERDLDTLYKLNDNISFKLLRNSHCLGASQLELFIRKPSNMVKKITYTSDIGSSIKTDKPFVTDMEYSTKSNLHIEEGTYGSNSRSYTHKDVKEERYDMKENIKNIIKNGGQVLLPTFSFSRTQEVLVDLYNMFKDDKEFGYTPVIIDSKLSVNITECYSRILKGEDKEIFTKATEWSNVQMNKNIDGTRLIIAQAQPCVILSSQGFLDAGRSQLYAKTFLENERDAILFVGYCPDNSLGGRILNPLTKTVKIGTVRYNKSCFTKSYKTYSSHAQHDELIDYIKMVNTDQVIIHHSAKEAKRELIEDAREELRKIGKTTTITGCTKKMEVIL